MALHPGADCNRISRWYRKVLAPQLAALTEGNQGIFMLSAKASVLSQTVSVMDADFRACMLTVVCVHPDVGPNSDLGATLADQVSSCLYHQYVSAQLNKASAQG